jgi:hypothetical protein
MGWITMRSVAQRIRGHEQHRPVPEKCFFEPSKRIVTTSHQKTPKEWCGDLAE